MLWTMCVRTQSFDQKEIEEMLSEQIEFLEERDKGAK